MTNSIISRLLFGFVVISLASCNTPQTQTLNPLEANLVKAGKNRPELEKILVHYRKNTSDSLKLKAAIILLSNIEENKYYQGEWITNFNSIFEHSGSLSDDSLKHYKATLLQKLGPSKNTSVVYDLEVLKSSYLIEHIDQAFDAWQNTPWKNSVSFDTFCNYILPYKNFGEQPESWRLQLRNRYQTLLVKRENPDSAMFHSCCAINDELTNWFRYTDHLNDYPGRISFTNLLKGKRGNCADMSNLAAYAHRAVGIPVAIDYAPLWGNYSDGHIWNALISNTKSLHFMGAEGNPIDYAPFFVRNESKLAKVYRKILISNENSFVKKAQKLQIEDIPTHLSSPRIIDVTELYATTATVTLSVDEDDNTPVYLCVFQNGSWQAIAGTFIQNKKAIFEKMGTNILYMPMFYNSKKYEAAGNPFLLTLEKQIKPLKPDAKQSVTFYRKYPLKRHRAKWTLAQYFDHCRIEGANSPDFKDATLLHTITNPFDKDGIKDNGGAVARDRLDYASMWEEANIGNKTPFRYVRLLSFNKPEDPLKIGELAIIGTNSPTPLTGKPIGSEQHPEWAFDGVHGQSIVGAVPNSKGQWVGLDLGKPTPLSKVQYLPANDKNIITPTKNYELFYWDNKWVSLGRKEATSFEIRYNDVPSGAVYWLHCHNCKSSEERPFTYENGKQIWW